VRWCNGNVWTSVREGPSLNRGRCLFVVTRVILPRLSGRMPRDYLQTGQKCLLPNECKHFPQSSLRMRFYISYEVEIALLNKQNFSHHRYFCSCLRFCFTYFCLYSDEWMDFEKVKIQSLIKLISIPCSVDLSDSFRD
jgi:hypothetical protein